MERRPIVQLTDHELELLWFEVGTELENSVLVEVGMEMARRGICPTRFSPRDETKQNRGVI